MRIALLMVFCTVLAGSFLPPDASAAPRCNTGCEDFRDCRPYGGYCRNKNRGFYGGRREVRSEKEARSLLTEYFSGGRASIGRLVEKETYFEAEVLNPRGILVDRVIVDKRSGRIRSTY